MVTLLYRNPRFRDHVIAPGHPERPERLDAVDVGVEASGVVDDVVAMDGRPATIDELARVHGRGYLDRLAELCESGGGRIDADTGVVPESWEVARLAAGSGIDAVERLRAGAADAAFLALRPPGHHATPGASMGFCLLNNVAVTAAALVAAGESVAIVDIDAHHGNGTQDAFWDDPAVTFVSLHQWPLYPGTGSAEEVGGPSARGTTVNLPVPAGAAGSTYRRLVEEVVCPVVERSGAAWLLISCGYDAHRADPLTDLGLTAGDYADLVQRLTSMVPPGRRLVFLEGGYDLGAVANSTAGTMAALAGVQLRPEPLSEDGDAIGRSLAGAARSRHGLE